MSHVTALNEPADELAPSSEMGFNEALQWAIRLHQNKQLQGAEQLYLRLLDAVPEHPDVLHLLGMVRHQMGRPDEGIALIERAIAVQPSYAGFHNNLGNIYAGSGKVPKALAAYQQAVSLDQNNADLYNNLGALFKAERQFEEALAAYQRALALDPRHINAHNNLGLLYAALGDRPNAIAWYVKALELMPGDSTARRLLGSTYYATGRIADAGEVYRQWMEAEPDHPTARHMYAACTGNGVPERAPDDYVEQAFDGFAASFESVLNERLAYQAPQLCADMLARHLPPPQPASSITNWCCGTGLCGPLMAPWAKALAGVDLSRGMLDRAQTKGVYGDLYKAELTEFLQLSPGQWDVVLSADTLCYFGDLHQVIQAAAGSMKPGGILVFTVEALPDDAPQGHQIQPHGRYAHARGHLVSAISRADLRLLDVDEVILREEGGKPVKGYLVAATRG